MDELAKISVIDYSKVGRNPLVSGRFGASDFLYLTDGAGVGILDLEKIVIEQDYRNKTVAKGYGYTTLKCYLKRRWPTAMEVNIHFPVQDRQAGMYVHWRANIEVDDNDLFEKHDCFTSSECGTLSVFSLTETGK